MSTTKTTETDPKQQDLIVAPESSALLRPAQPTTPMALLQIAMSQNADIDKLTRLMELQERWEAGEARKAYNAAMSKFKANPPQITKNKHVAFGSGDKRVDYSHATLDHVTAAITQSLSAVGIGHRWNVAQNGPEIAVSCILTHEQGHSEETTLKATADTSGSKNAIQAIGSAVTYLQRYTLLAATGLAAAGSDDDGATTNGELKDRIDHMNKNCHTADELRDAFKAAWTWAHGNSSAQAAIKAAYDARKEGLGKCV